MNQAGLISAFVIGPVPIRWREHTSLVELSRPGAGIARNLSGLNVPSAAHATTVILRVRVVRHLKRLEMPSDRDRAYVDHDGHPGRREPLWPSCKSRSKTVAAGGRGPAFRWSKILWAIFRL